MRKPAVNLAHIQALSFDLDDTLWDCDPVIAGAEQAVYQWFAEHTPNICSNYSLQALRLHRSAFAESHPEYKADVSFLRRESIKALLSECGYSRALAEPAFACFYQARSQVTLYDAALPVLETLKRRYPIAAVTNGNADLHQIGIAHLFDDIQAATLSNSPKPHRMMFDQAATAMGVQLKQILHIGDNPVSDVGGGLAAGAMTVWFNQYNKTWPEHLPGPDVEIQQLGQLLEILPVSD